jgi:GT2 family glycosyltransferase
VLALVTISAVIPTRNRPHDLVKAVASIRAQTRPPEELLIIDQSPGDDSASMIPPLFDGAATRLVYIHDTGITGLVDAKRVGSTRAAGDIVCFLEDDVELEPDYIEQIERAFTDRPDMIGCSGIITNWPVASSWFVAAHAVFFRGIFKDPRIGKYVRAAAGTERDLIQCDVLAGGLSAWRKQVFARVPFDVRNGFFMFEDMEFATRVVREYGHHLYINPRARLEHHWSPANRDVRGLRERRKLAEMVTYYKTRARWPGARVGLVMLTIWYLADAVRQAVTLRATGPIKGFLHGLLDGYRKPIVP